MGSVRETGAGHDRRGGARGFDGFCANDKASRHADLLGKASGQRTTSDRIDYTKEAGGMAVAACMRGSLSGSGAVRAGEDGEAAGAEGNLRGEIP